MIRRQRVSLTPCAGRGLPMRGSLPLTPRSNQPRPRPTFTAILQCPLSLAGSRARTNGVADRTQLISFQTFSNSGNRKRRGTECRPPRRHSRRYDERSAPRAPPPHHRASVSPGSRWPTRTASRLVPSTSSRLGPRAPRPFELYTPRPPRAPRPTIHTHTHLRERVACACRSRLPPPSRIGALT